MLTGKCLEALGGGSFIVGRPFGFSAIWGSGGPLRGGYLQMLCKLTSSRRVLAPRGFTSVTLIRYWLQNSAPWTTQRAAPGGSCGHGQGPVDELILRGRMESWALEMVIVGFSWSPSLSLISYLWTSAPGTVFFLTGRGPSEVRKEKRILPLPKASLRTSLPAYIPTLCWHAQMNRHTCPVVHSPVGGEVAGG